MSWFKRRWNIWLHSPLLSPFQIIIVSSFVTFSYDCILSSYYSPSLLSSPIPNYWDDFLFIFYSFLYQRNLYHRAHVCKQHFLLWENITNHRILFYDNETQRKICLSFKCQLYTNWAADNASLHMHFYGIILFSKE